MKNKWYILGWKEVWRCYSFWAASVGFGVLLAWNQIPDELRYLMPRHVDLVIGGLLWASVVFARITSQPIVHDALDGEDPE